MIFLNKDATKTTAIVTDQSESSQFQPAMLVSEHLTSLPYLMAVKTSSPANLNAEVQMLVMESLISLAAHLNTLALSALRT